MGLLCWLTAVNTLRNVNALGSTCCAAAVQFQQHPNKYRWCVIHMSGRSTNGRGYKACYMSQLFRWEAIPRNSRCLTMSASIASVTARASNQLHSLISCAATMYKSSHFKGHHSGKRCWELLRIIFLARSRRQRQMCRGPSFLHNSNGNCK